MLWLCFEADLFDTFRIAFPAVTSEKLHYSDRDSSIVYLA